MTDQKPVELPPQLGLSDALLVQQEERTELDKIFELLLSEENIHHNTELNRNEILAFSVLATMGRRYNLPVLQDFLKENMKLRVSKNRRGRDEWVKIASRQLQNEALEQLQQGSRFGNFFRRPPERR